MGNGVGNLPGAQFFFGNYTHVGAWQPGFLFVGMQAPCRTITPFEKAERVSSAFLFSCVT
jgi:hypothetical protein